MAGEVAQQVGIPNPSIQAANHSPHWDPALRNTTGVRRKARKVWCIRRLSRASGHVAHFFHALVCYNVIRIT